MIYYLDESGHTGDVAKSKDLADFAQSVFVLACIGVNDEDLAEEIARLRAKYRIQAPELKSKDLKEKPQLVIDLLRYLATAGCPLYVEVVEKRFLLCINMIERLIMPAVGAFDLEPTTIVFKNHFAEYLHANLPTSIMRAYVDVCEERSLDAARRAYDELHTWLEGRAARDEVAEGIHKFSIETRQDFEERAAEDSGAWASILPIPDDSKKGRPFWMLPNYSCLTNIYARINLHHQGAIGALTLIHDEQLHYDEILGKAKEAAETPSTSSAALPFLHADFNFTQKADLKFACSYDHLGIQVADVIAGFVMRYAQDRLFSQTSISRSRMEAFHTIFDLFPPGRGTGVNFVLTTRDVKRLGVEPLPGIRMG